MAERIVVLGGVRSGKSALAERFVADAPAVTCVATGSASDAEMAARIAAHRARRPAHWRTVEVADDPEPATALVRALAEAGAASDVLVDSLGAWLAARLHALGLLEADTEPDPATAGALHAEAARFWEAAGAHPGRRVVVVADEAGLGGVPVAPAARRWLDLAGEVAQSLAATADRALLAVAGRALELPPALHGCTQDAVRVPAASADVAGIAAGGLRAHGDTLARGAGLDFAVNVHHAGPPAHVRRAVDAALADPRAYPDDAEARAAAAARHGRSPREVCITAGAAAAFWLLARAIAACRAVVVHPAFTEPEAALRAAGVPVAHVYRRASDGWGLEPAEVPDDADLVVLGNPNNPTGTLDPPDRVAGLCRPGRVTVVDEAFAEHAFDEASLAGRGDLPGLVVVRSITKLWGIAGLRAGYLLAPEGLVRRLAAQRQPWPVGAGALAALAACVGDVEGARRRAADVAARRDALSAALADLPGVATWPSAANFVLARVPDGPAVVAALAERGIAVRPSTFPGLDADHVRIAVRDERDQAALVAALGEVLGA